MSTPNRPDEAASNAPGKLDEVAVIGHLAESRRRRRRWPQWLLAGGVIALAWVVLREESPAAPATPSTRSPGKARDPAAAELASKFKGAYPEVVPEHGERRYELRAAPTQMQIVPGTRTPVWAYNGQVPGPILHARVGERLRIAFENGLPQPTTIHWHGVRVPNAMDGTPDVTQPAVQPGGSFEYSFVPREAGTFWYHPHVRGSEQLERGLQGVLVVDDDKPPPWSRDVVWVVDDWRLDDDGKIDPNFNSMHDLMHDGRWGNVVTVNGHANEELAVRPGERFRLRLVNTANARVFVPDVGPLIALAIAVDGMYAEKPFDPRGFELAPGNRLDLDITVPVTLRGKTVKVMSQFGGRPFALASIRVSDEAPATTPNFPTLARGHFPDWTAGVNAEPSVTYRLSAQHGGEFGIAWTLNGKPYGHDTPAVLGEGEWLKARYVNETSRLHPMHMHGVFFRVLARNGQPAVEPHWRDTVLVHPQESVDVALVPIDRGKWMLHCHVLEHAEAGMMTVFEVTPNK